MSRALWSSILRIAALLALSASAALLVDYLSADPTFCGGASGCGEVRRSAWAYPFGIPALPVLGVVAFSTLLGLSLRPKLLRVAAWLALAGGLLAIALLAVQAAVIGAFCSLCVVVDGSALLSAGAALALLTVNPGTKAEGREPLRSFTWAALGLLAVAAPLAWPSLRPAPDVPEGVRKHYVAGKINVVEFVDFQCPFCRMLHPTLKSVAAEFGDRVNFVRLDLPLASHGLARGAARAHVCGQAQGQGERTADALFESEDLSPHGLHTLARELGLKMPAFEHCLASPETEAQIVSTESILRDAGMLQGLPTTFVGGQMLVGAREAPAFRDAFERAARGESERGVPAPIYLAAFALAAGLLVFFGRRAPGGESTATGDLPAT